jgi:PAS domain S-box-containing protein
MSEQTTPSSLFQDGALMASVIAQATDDVIFAKDLAGRYQFANPATLAAMGRADVIGFTDAELMADPAVARRLMANDRQVIELGAVLEAEEVVPLPDGTARHWLSRKMPLRDAAGTTIGVLGIARDITARKLAQARSDDDRLKLQIAMQAADLVTAEIDYRTDRNHISAELARLLELGDGEMTVPRQAVFDRVHPDDRDRYVQGIQRTLDPNGSGHLAIDVRALLPSGYVRWLHIRLQVTFAEIDGVMRPHRGICAARDVTTERVAERRLQAAQRLAESVIEGAGALVYAKDLAGRYILANQAWRAQHRLMAPEQAHGVSDEQIFGAATAALLRANDEQVARTGQPLLVQERVDKDGQPVVYRSSKFPLYDEDGQIYAVCGVSTDITDVVEADQRKDEFIATLAHELRNPLAPIRTGLEILKRVGELPPQAARTREVMERQLTHMVRLVDDLLDVSRISRGRLELRLEPITLDQVIQSALEACQPAIDAAGHALSVEQAAMPLRVHADHTRLAQVVSNLVGNAIRYTPAGGRIEVSTRAEAGQAVIAVTDTGVGIAPGMLERIFDLFTQGSTAQRQGGLGIGLWLVRRLVELHHGQIDATSPGPGQGSVFTVRLPLMPA